MTNGLVSQTHGNKHRQPKNAYSFDNLIDVAQFMSNYAEEHGLSQPAAINTNIDGHILLPFSESKQSLYSMFKDVCADNDKTVVGLTTIRCVLQCCCPNEISMYPQRDICE